MAPHGPTSAGSVPLQVIGRLPKGIEYTYIKMILGALPSGLTTLTWHTDDPMDTVWTAFGRKSYLTLDRLIRQREGAVANLPPDAPERQTVQAQRHAWVEQVHHEMSIHPTKVRIAVRHVWVPPGYSKETTAIPGDHIDVWRQMRRGEQTLIEQHIVPTTPASWNRAVSWVDPTELDQRLAALFRRHLSDLLRRRRGSRWRSHRPPAGWPALTRYAIPMLYDYLRPYYAVRRYTHRLRTRSPGTYPTALRHDIRDILRLERPDLAARLTLGQVTAAIQRWVGAPQISGPWGSI